MRIDQQMSYNFRKERTVLESEKEKIGQEKSASAKKATELEQRVQFYQNSHEQMTKRLHKLEFDDKARSDRVMSFTLFQGGAEKRVAELRGVFSKQRKFG